VINSAAAENGLLVAMEYELTGRLDELERSLARSGADNCFDVVHLTGHGASTEDGPRFVTVGPHGGQRLADVRELHQALTDSRPRMVFLSGCGSAASGDLGAAVSLAEGLAKSLARTVVGWGRPIDGSAATSATKDFYRELLYGLAGPCARLGLPAADRGR
jgi:CHAT domain-containing protein